MRAWVTMAALLAIAAGVVAADPARETREQAEAPAKLDGVMLPTSLPGARRLIY